LVSSGKPELSYRIVSGGAKPDEWVLETKDGDAVVALQIFASKSDAEEALAHLIGEGT
jgi:hypothetical protein